MERLLEDVHEKFNEPYEEEKERSSQAQTAVAGVPFLLYEYLCHEYHQSRITEKVYVVDGQQRLTTLTLILIAMYRI